MQKERMYWVWKTDSKAIRIFHSEDSVVIINRCKLYDVIRIDDENLNAVTGII
jgi:hypothetical protein